MDGFVPTDHAANWAVQAAAVGVAKDVAAAEGLVAGFSQYLGLPVAEETLCGLIPANDLATVSGRKGWFGSAVDGSRGA
jgi:hypothetical protein